MEPVCLSRFVFSRVACPFLCLAVAASTLFVPSTSRLLANDGDKPDDVTKSHEFEFVPSTDHRFSEIDIQNGLPESIDRDVLDPDSDESAKYFWFQYGDESSRAICLKFSQDLPNQIQVDVNRNQKLSDKEIFKNDGDSEWFIDLKSEFGQMRSRTSKQRVRIRRDATSSSWHLATAGTRQGKVNFNDLLCDAMIEDKNGNGLWFDSEDRLFVDFDGNGKISRISERIPAQGVRKIGGKIYGIIGNASGKTVGLSEVTGTGFLIPKLELLDPAAKVTSIIGELGSNAGIGISIDSLDAPIEVPVGDWHVESLQCEITGDDGIHQFTFARSGSKELVTINDSNKKDVDLIGQLTLTAGVSTQIENEKLTLILTPSLTTTSGCYLVASKTGKRLANNDNRLIAYSRSPQQDLEVGSSGFS